MKTKILMTVLSLLIAVSTFAQENEGVQFQTAPMAELLKQSKETGKPIFLDVYAVWCGPCKYMTSTIFPQKEAGDYFNANFIPAKIDGESKEGDLVMKKYKIGAFPTFLILNDKGEEIGRITGTTKSVEDIIKKTEKVMKKTQ